MQKKILISAFVFALAMPLGIVFAENSAGTQSTHDTINAQREQNRADFQDQRDKNKEAQDALKQQNRQTHCKNIETRIDTRINRYENSGHMFTTVFGNMSARIQRLIDRLKAKNVDVSKLQADLVTLDGKIDILLADQTAFMQTLQDAKSTSTTCDPADQTDGTLKTKTGEARKVSLKLEQDRLDIRNFFQTTLKPDLLAIRKKLASQKTTPGTENTADDTTTATGTATDTTLQPTL